MEKKNSRKLTRPYSFIFYSLSLFVGFFTGGFYVIVTGAAEGQGLAAGAIAVFYAICFALGFILLSILLAYLLSRKIVIILNWILLVLLLICVGITINRFMEQNRSELLSGTFINKKIETGNTQI